MILLIVGDFSKSGEVNSYLPIPLLWGIAEGRAGSPLIAIELLLPDRILAKLLLFVVLLIEGINGFEDIVCCVSVGVVAADDGRDVDENEGDDGVDAENGVDGITVGGVDDVDDDNDIELLELPLLVIGVNVLSLIELVCNANVDR